MISYKHFIFFFFACFCYKAKQKKTRREKRVFSKALKRNKRDIFFALINFLSLYKWPIKEKRQEVKREKGIKTI